MKCIYPHTYQKSMWWRGPTPLVEAETRCRNPGNWSSRPKGFRNIHWQNLDKAAQCPVWVHTKLNCSPNRTGNSSRHASFKFSTCVCSPNGWDNWFPEYQASQRLFSFSWLCRGNMSTTIPADWSFCPVTTTSSTFVNTLAIQHFKP